MIKRHTERKLRVLIAGALALTAQGALSEEAAVEVTAPVEAPAHKITVTTPDLKARITVEKIDSGISKHIEALDQQIERDRQEQIEAIRDSRLELVIAEIPTRG